MADVHLTNQLQSEIEAHRKLIDLYSKAEECLNAFKSIGTYTPAILQRIFELPDPAWPVSAAQPKLHRPPSQKPTVKPTLPKPATAHDSSSSYVSPEKRIRAGKKRCTGPCGRTLPMSDFGKVTSAPDGHNSRCKDCINKLWATCACGNKMKEFSKKCRDCYQKADKPSSAPSGLYVGTERVGMIKCNQCPEMLSPKELAAHKLQRHPATDNPGREESVIQSQLGRV